MSNAIDARTFRNITRGGSVQGGNGIFFELDFEGSGLECFHCDHSLVPKLLGNIRQYGAMADASRIKPGASALDVSAPYVVALVDRGAHSDDGLTIAIEFGVSDGFPIQLAMTPDQARETIEILQHELTLATNPPPPDRRN